MPTLPLPPPIFSITDQIITMLSSLHKSKQISLIALDRMSDYMDLLRVEVKIREQQLGLRLAGYMAAALFGLLATIFFGLAIIVSFWDSDYRALAAWFVVLLYGVIAAASLWLCMKQKQPQSLADTMRGELRRDIDTIKESL